MRKTKWIILLFLALCLTGCGYDDVYKEYKEELDSLSCTYYASEYVDTSPYPSANYSIQFTADSEGLYIALDGQLNVLYDNDGIHSITVGDYPVNVDEDVLLDFLNSYRSGGCPAQIFLGVNVNDPNSAEFMDSCSAGDGVMGLCFLYTNQQDTETQEITSGVYRKYSDTMNRYLEFSFGYDPNTRKSYFYLDNVQHEIVNSFLQIPVQQQGQYIAIDGEDYAEIFQIDGDHVTFPDADEIYLAYYGIETSNVLYITTNPGRYSYTDKGTERPDSGYDEEEDVEEDADDGNDETNYSVVDTNVEDICASRNYRVPMRFLGITLNFVKIAVPVLIIIFGLIDLYKAITASKDDAIKKAVKSIALRVVAGVFIFLLPGLIQFVLNLVQEWSKYNVNWCCCTECLLNGDCDVNIDSCSDSCSIGGMNG